MLLLVNVTFTGVRNNVSEGGERGVSLLTFTRCLQEESAASCVSALYRRAGWIWKITDPPLRRRDTSSSTMHLQYRGVMVQTEWIILIMFTALTQLQWGLYRTTALKIQNVNNQPHGFIVVV